MKVKELIELLENSERKYVMETLYEFEFDARDKCEKVASHVNVVEYRDRGYSVATDVYKCEDGLVGVTAGYELLSEQVEWDDICPDTDVSEYEAEQTIIYRPKK